MPENETFQLHDDELPEGWALTTLDKVGKWSTGGTPSRKNSSYFGDGIPWVKSGDLPDGLVTKTEETLSHEGMKNSAAKLLRTGSLSLALYGATIGKLGILGLDAATNQACANCEINERAALTWFIFYYLLQQRKRLIEAGQGGAQPNLTNQIVREWPVVLSPLAEQQRIVAKVEALLARVNAARQRLAKVPAMLKRFRQSVLAAACSGRLTADWREQNESESAQVLISRILKLVGRSQEKADRNDEEGLDDLPKNWAWESFGQLIKELRNGIGTKPNPDPPGHPILRISAVRSGKVILDEIRFHPDADNLVSLYRLQDGDLLFTRYNGSLDLLGVCGMVRGLENRTLVYPDKLMRVRIGHSQLLPAYVELFFGSPQARDRIEAKSKSSAGQQGVSGADIKGQPIAIPPLAEQHEIVRRVNTLFKTADAIEKRVAAATARAEKLTQAILAKAFRGELVPTEAELARKEARDYEPASVLLERIGTERAKNSSSPPKRRKDRAKNCEIGEPDAMRGVSL